MGPDSEAVKLPSNLGFYLVNLGGNTWYIYPMLAKGNPKPRTGIKLGRKPRRKPIADILLQTSHIPWLKLRTRQVGKKRC